MTDLTDHKVLAERMKKFFSGDYSADMEVLLRSGRRVKVNRDVLMNGSSLFCMTLQKKEDKVIDMTSYTDIAVNRFIKYLYCCQRSFDAKDPVEVWFDLLELVDSHNQTEYRKFMIDMIKANINDNTETDILYWNLQKMNIQISIKQDIKDTVDKYLYCPRVDKLVLKLTERKKLEGLNKDDKTVSTKLDIVNDTINRMYNLRPVVVTACNKVLEKLNDYKSATISFSQKEYIMTKEKVMMPTSGDDAETLLEFIKIFPRLKTYGRCFNHIYNRKEYQFNVWGTDANSFSFPPAGNDSYFTEVRIVNEARVVVDVFYREERV
jgi:hypothetical protein